MIDPAALPVEIDREMNAEGWKILAADGRVIARGLFGMGELVTPGEETTIPAKIICSPEAFETLKRLAAEYAPRLELARIQ